MSEKQKKYFTKLKIFAVVFVLVGCGVYLCAINIGAVKGYEIRKVEKKIADLKKQNKQLQIQEAELSSFYNIKKNANDLNMQEVKEIVYIDGAKNIMALK